MSGMQQQQGQTSNPFTHFQGSTAEWEQRFASGFRPRCLTTSQAGLKCMASPEMRCEVDTVVRDAGLRGGPQIVEIWRKHNKHNKKTTAYSIHRNTQEHAGKPTPKRALMLCTRRADKCMLSCRRQIPRHMRGGRGCKWRRIGQVGWVGNRRGWR